MRYRIVDTRDSNASATQFNHCVVSNAKKINCFEGEAWGKVIKRNLSKRDALEYIQTLPRGQWTDALVQSL